MPKIKDCQSCGMPLKYDENPHYEGKVYCNHCYVDGHFTQPNITMEEMVSLVEDKMVEMKFPRFLAKLFAKKVKKLDRWKK